MQWILTTLSRVWISLTALLHNLWFIPHRLEFSVIFAAQWQIQVPRRGAFWIPHPPWDLGSRCISCGAKSAEQKPAQCSTSSGTTTHLRSHVFNSIRPRGGLQAICLHVSEEFSCTTWEGCSWVFPLLMLLIKPHAFSSACARPEASLWSRGGFVLYCTLCECISYKPPHRSSCSAPHVSESSFE